MIDLTIQTQPDDETCGPTSLHAIYNYYGLDIPLNDVINGIERSLSGGTLAPMLGAHALKQGLQATIYIYNVNVFDPTWFKHGEADNEEVMEKLIKQLEYKEDPFIAKEAKAYYDYLKLDGKLRFSLLDLSLLNKYFDRGIPIITSLSATYFYNSAREYFTPDGHSIYDDIKGSPCGHFVILCGYDKKTQHVIIADPHPKNPLFNRSYYKVGVNRLINSIMLGVLTYDANLLIIEPKER